MTVNLNVSSAASYTGLREGPFRSAKPTTVEGLRADGATIPTSGGTQPVAASAGCQQDDAPRQNDHQAIDNLVGRRRPCSMN